MGQFSVEKPGAPGSALSGNQHPALPPGGGEYKGSLRVRNGVELTVVGLAERGVRSSIVRIPPIMHSTSDNAGFLPLLIGLAKEKGFIGYPGDGANVWPAVHARDLASLFRLALEKGPAGKSWHGIEAEGIRFREIAEALASRLDLPAVPIPADVLMLRDILGSSRIWSRWTSRRPTPLRARPSAGNPLSPACSRT